MKFRQFFCRHVLAGFVLASLGLLFANQSATGQERKLQRPSRSGEAFGGPLRFRHLVPIESSVELAVFSIYQDELGFMWFGTEDGLFRHDGYTVRPYRPIPFDTTSISDPWTNEIQDAGNMQFWLTTQSGGLNRYNALTDTFDRISGKLPSRLQGLAIDADSVVWVASGYDGLFRFDPATGESINLRADANDPASIPANRLTAVYSAIDGALWVATLEKGLCRFNRASGICHTYRFDPDDEASLPSDRVQALMEDREGRLWVGTNGGLARLDAATDSFVRYPIVENRDGESKRSANNVVSLLEHPDGDLLVGTAAGLDLLNPETGRRTSYRHSDLSPSSISSGTVYALFLDRTGVIWVGTDSGVSFIRSTPSPFEHLTHDPTDPNSLSDPEVWSIFVDSDEMLWVGTSFGLNRVDRRTGKVSRYLPDPTDVATLSSGLVMGIHETRDGSFWVGTRRGALHLFDRKTGRVTARYRQIDGDSTSLLSDNPWWILEDRKGRTWITSGGAGCLAEMPTVGQFVRHCHDPNDPNTPAHDFARYMIEGSDGMLWLATWGGGLDRIDPETLRYTHYRHNPADRNTPSSDFLLSIIEYDDGSFWLGTYGAGFSRFDPGRERFTHYNSHNSDLASDVVYEIQSDDDGNLWLSTNAGLVRFNPGEESFRTFGVADGIQDMEFNSGASFRTASGELFFGGVNGVNAFYPRDVVIESMPPNVVLTALQAGDRLVESMLDSPANASLPYADEIRLKPNQRDIAISFAALDYVNPELNQYRYRLVGYDDEWHHSGKNRTATYTNLGPGSYEFRVAASNSDGVWNEEALAVNVVVLPMIQETVFAKLLYALMLVGLLVALYRYRRNRLIMQHKMHIEHLEVRKLRELDKTRSLFFANVSHEFRTPLTLTLGPVDDVLAGLHGAVSETAREQLQLARRNAARVLDLINQILDVARLEAGHTRLRARPIDLQTFVDEVSLVFVPLADRKAMSFEFERSEDRIEVWADPSQLEKVLFNLLSNAFKFTGNGGTVRVSIRREEQFALVSVRDNGPGIPAADLPFVFDRFHQANEPSTRTQPGTGIGLALSREIVDLHRGSISVVSEEGFGSTFTVRLALGRTHLTDDQIDTPSTAVANRDPDRELSLIPTESNWPNGIGGDGESSDEDVTTILVVEDHPDVRSYIRFHLEPEYRILEASDGVQALDRVRTELPDLVVSDVMMPKMDGFELCRELKANAETDFIPIVLLTARAAQQDRIEGLKGQADAYLTKPFDPEELLLLIDNLLSLRRRLRAVPHESAPSVASSATDSTGIRSAEATFMEGLLALVDRRLADESLNVESLAEEAGVSRTKLFRDVRRFAGTSPSELIRDRRLDRAASLLKAGAGNVSEIAYATGFKSLAHFSRCFVQKFGCPPSTYKESLLAPKDS